LIVTANDYGVRKPENGGIIEGAINSFILSSGFEKTDKLHFKVTGRLQKIIDLILTTLRVSK